MELTLLLVIIAFGTYFQTVTGFGLAIIIVGLTSAFKLYSLPVVAAIISLITVANCVTALKAVGRRTPWRKWAFTVVGSIPGVYIGVWGLNHLSGDALSVLEFLLGGMILYSAISLFRRTAAKQELSSFASFSVAGFASGLSGGLFGLGGPPLIYHFYRQPMAIEHIRALLLSTFLCSSLSRTIILAWENQLTPEILTISAIAIPLVMVVTYLTQKYPSNIEPNTMRKGIALVLFLIAIRLMAPFFIDLIV
ncbi:sulfite exporter TauE/SafE family protein [Vibrio nigripulchritudo]|uniref:sulfite exporter TauE/SafE family protein n=1 Tax=Vibrio nigripulchritudo TaxID=28173 RepID=UPI002491DB08|nr:sulfite exporter TauE/SafE family protein [Vibrio nigripulchritudo]BDU39261.1 membrane protein [Vibrio nigripulchritudo]